MYMHVRKTSSQQVRNDGFRYLYVLGLGGSLLDEEQNEGADEEAHAKERLEGDDDGER